MKGESSSRQGELSAPQSSSQVPPCPISCPTKSLIVNINSENSENSLFSAAGMHSRQVALLQKLTLSPFLQTWTLFTL